jgi:6-pyruvoyltetrahydropterin/6-carboxytetrahydropterin synthase
MFKIERKFTFDSAHRVEGHPKCGRLHGHTYHLEVEVSARYLDEKTGFVIDFADLDAIVKRLVDVIDHRYLISQANVVAGDIYAKVAMEDEERQGDFVLLPVIQTTAECLCSHIYTEVRRGLMVFLENTEHTQRAWVSAVRLWETPKNMAEYIPS